jgi:hypothetical protein
VITDSGAGEMKDRLGVDKTSHVDSPARGIPLCFIGCSRRSSNQSQNVVASLA